MCVCANVIAYDVSQTSVSGSHRQIIGWSRPRCHSTRWVCAPRNELVCPVMMTLSQACVSVYVRWQHNTLKAIAKVNIDALGSWGRKHLEEIK